MPTKYPKGRDTTSFSANITASLKICHKNALVDENHIAVEMAKQSAEVVYSSVIKPLWSVTKETFFSNFPQAKTPPTSHQTISKSKVADDDKNLVSPEQVDNDLKNKLIRIEGEIKKHMVRKKLIDKEEQQNKDNKKLPLLSEEQKKERLKLIESIDQLLYEKVQSTQGHIQEHALRRLDIMFLLMITLYKKNVTVIRGKTDRQHGKGSKETGTAACHASLIPNPTLEPIKKNVNETPTFWRQLYSFYNPSTTTIPAPLVSLKNIYIYDLCNLTNELSNIVNEFDGHLEGKWLPSNAVQASIDTVNKVATGELNPIEGISEFGTIMNVFFTHLKSKYLLLETTYSATAHVQYPKAFKEVWHYQRYATLSMFTKHKQDNLFEDSLVIKPSYISSMLNLASLSTTQHLTSYISSTPVENRIMEMQNEIWHHSSDYSDKLNNKKP